MKSSFILYFAFILGIHQVFSSTTQSYVSSTALEEQQCDIVLEHGLCLYGGDKVLFADAVPEGLIGHWNFDDYYGLDSSGNHHHVASPLKAGPAMGGSGSSAAIDATNYITIPSATDFNSQIFSISFWVFLVKENFDDSKTEGLQWCPLLYKGNEDSDKKEIARAPAILLNKKDGTVMVALSTSANDTNTEGESITSNAILPQNRWAHIAVVRTDTRLRLYINGILDSVIQTLGSTVSNDYPIYIGNTPFTQGKCSISAYVDELRYYSRELLEQEIEAEAGPSLGNMHPGFVHLGCINCALSQAAGSCIEGYHLCSTIELHSGVYQIARTLGWTRFNSRIWSYSAIKKESETDENLGLAVCCVD